MSTNFRTIALIAALLVLSVVLTGVLSGVAVPAAKDRIFVDQWSPTRSELFIADGGQNARLLAL